LLRRLTYVQLLSRPAILLLWLGQVTSTMGDRLYEMALLWLVMEWTGSPRTMALVTLAGKLPAACLGLLAGAILDRVDKLRTLRWIDWARAALVGLLPVLWWLGLLGPWSMAVVAALLGALGIFFDPGIKAAVTEMVEPEYVGSINGLLDATSRLGLTLGPALAAALVSVVPMVHFFSLDALTFVISALLLGLIIRRAPLPAGHAHRAQGSLRAEALEGFRIAWENPFLRWGLTVRVIGNICWPAFTLGIPLLVAGRFQASAGLYGLILTVYTATSFGANLVAGNLRLPSSLALFCAAWLYFGLAFIGLGFAPTPTVALLIAGLAGLCVPVLHIVLDAYVAQVLPPHERGRYFALQQVCIIGAGSIGLPLMGFWIARFGPQSGLVAGGVGMIVGALFGLLGTAKRQMDQRPKGTWRSST
jgi:DHA3 family macrolide efflux protein-like MFS transporter